MNRLHIPLLLGAAAWMATACKPPQDVPRTPPPELAPPMPMEGARLAPPGDDPAPPPPPAPPVTPAKEPDWQARGHALMAQFAPEFTPPAVGSPIAIRTTSDSNISGVIQGLTDQALTLELASGTVTYPRERLHAQTRAQLFQEDYAFLKAKAVVEQEQRAFQEQLARAKAGTGAPPVNAADGSVLQVLDYLRDNLRNPDKVRYLEWGRVLRHGENGYVVSLKYQTLGGAFGVTTEDKYFFMDHTGKVVRTAARKGEGVAPLQ